MNYKDLVENKNSKYSIEKYSLNRESASNKIFRILKQEILAGEISPETKLIEHKLANQFDVGRSTIREALMQLESYGLVIKTKKGRSVQSVNQKDIEELYELWEAVEGFAASLACQNSKKKTIEKLSSLINEMEENLQNSAEYRKLNLLFHETLISDCPNIKLKNLHKKIINQVRWYLNYTISSSDNTKQSLNEHKHILDLVISKNSNELEATVRNHLAKALERPEKLR